MPTESDRTLAVVCRNVAPVRLEPDADSEQDTQIALGQRAFILKESGEWTRIETWDGCEGWVNANAVSPVDCGTPYASVGTVARVREVFAQLHWSADLDSPIVTQAVIGSVLEMVAERGDWLEVRLPPGTAAATATTDTVLTRAFVRAGDVDVLDASVIPIGRSSTQEPPDPEALIRTAMKFIGVPYLWGGTTPFGIDCSGFVQLVHRFHFYNLPRNSRTQASDSRGLPVDRDALQPGDLVFFGKGRDPECGAPPLPPLQGEGVRHVGIALGSDRFIHSVGVSGVAVNTFDSSRYRDIYWGARRLGGATAP
jgi:gamma-D-glutamyl-L-lysine dipeptidyl-peptidase